MDNQELEVKFYVQHLSAVRQRLVQLGATLTQARVLETNLRFDAPDYRLMRAFQVLRLRNDTEARLTFKGPASALGGARLRQEIEFTVSSHAKARAFLEALGYEVVLMYEKFRAMYTLGDAQVTLDELPYGDFVEIEGADLQSIKQANEKLGLAWEANIPASYIMLFDLLRTKKSLSFQDLSFSNFAGLKVTAEDLGVVPADAAWSTPG